MLTATACINLDEQGYSFLSVEEKNKLNFALRLTPILCILTVIAGLYLQSWHVFAVLMVFGVLGSATNHLQPFDVLYNTVLRHLFSSPKLPPSPAQKRFACGFGAVILLGATISFYLGALTLGYVFGALYIVAAGLMAATHWCIASWLYNRVISQK